MAYTITPGADGSVQVSQGRGGYTVNPPMADEVTGVIGEYEPEVSPLFDDNFDRFDAFDALPPEIQQREQFASNPFTDANGSDEAIRNWILTPGIVSEQQMQAIIEGWEQNNLPENDRDLIVELLAYKEGSIGFEELGDEARGLLGFDQQATEYLTPADEILSELSEDAQEALSKADPEEVADLKAVGNELLASVPDPTRADEYSQAADQCYQNGDTEGAFLYALNAQFSSGQLTAREAVQTAISKLGLSAAYNAMLRLQQGDPESIEYGYTHANDYDTYDTDY
jgi:hypothetical protein